MSNELATKNATGTLVVRNMDDLARLGNMLAQSGYFKDAADAAQAGVKVLAGLEMGIGAFSAMSGIHIIEGKPSIGAGLMAAAVKRHPKYDYKVRAHTTTECVIEFFEAGETAGVSSFTIEDAKQAELKFKSFKGAPTPWAKSPRNMLFARALSNGVRWYCPDVFDVSTYTPEELGAEVDDEGNIVDVPSRPERPAAPALSAPAQEPAPAPEATPEPVQAAAEAEAQVDPHDEAVFALTESLKANEVAPKERMPFIRFITKRQIKRPTEMTDEELGRMNGWTPDQWSETLADYAAEAAGGPPDSPPDEPEPDWSGIAQPDESQPIAFDPSGKAERKPRKAVGA